MLRVVLAIALLALVSGVAFYVGRSSAPPSVAVLPAPEAPRADFEANRERTEPATSSLPPAVAPPLSPALPPAVAPSLDSSNPPAATSSAITPGEAASGEAASVFDKSLGLPLANLKAVDIHDTFSQSRGGGERQHEATDIMAPKGTPVVAVDTGIIAKLFTSKPGGLTVYQFDPSQKYAYYYAHLDRYAEGLREGMLLKKGDRVGYVGVTGNSDPNAPHLHFAIFELGPEKHWWQGKPINPYPILTRAMRK